MIIAAVVVLNTTIGVVQEVRAGNAIAALDRCRHLVRGTYGTGQWPELNAWFRVETSSGSRPATSCRPTSALWRPLRWRWTRRR